VTDGVGLKPCYAVHDETVYYRGLVSGSPGKKVDVTLSLQDVDSGANVGGPVTCRGLTFSKAGAVRTCGQFNTRPAHGHRYVVVESWRPSGGSGGASGTARSPIFGW